MKAVIQRVGRASVAIDGHDVGKIEKGLLIYLGVGADDGPDQVAWLVDKIANLRMFDDPAGPKTTFSVKDVGGAALVISQFTLLADARKGRRPSFSQASAPQKQGNSMLPLLTPLAERCPCKPARSVPTCR